MKIKHIKVISTNELSIFTINAQRIWGIYVAV